MSRTIAVLKTWVIKEGEGTKGHWVLRGVEANDSSGNPIPEQLKTFANLQLGEIEVEVERQEHPEYGTSFMLKPTGGQRRSANGGDLAALSERIARLESEVRRLSSLVDRRDVQDVPPTHQLAGASTPGIPDDDIPF